MSIHNQAERKAEDRTEIVTVWLDTTSDDWGWVVDTDIASGGESSTIKTYPPTEEGYAKAVAFGKKAAEKRGCELKIDGSASDSPADWCEDCESNECECE